MKTKRLSIKILTAFAVVAMIIAGIFAIYGANNTVKADTLAFEMVSGASLRVNEKKAVSVLEQKWTKQNTNKLLITKTFLWRL